MSLTQTHTVRRPAAASEERRIRALYVDYSVGFGGATKSTALVLRRLPSVDAIILTCQLPDIRTQWYDRWITYLFRLRMNYRTQEQFASSLKRRVRSTLARKAILKAVAVADAAIEGWNVVRILWLIRRHRIEMLHLNHGVMPTEALVAARLARIPAVAYLRGFFEGKDSAERRNAAMATLILGDSKAVTRSYLESASKPRPTATVYEVVDVEAFDAAAPQRGPTRSRWGIGEDDIAVGLFGRIVPWKGQREFVLAMIGAMQGDARLKACLVGNSSDGVSDYESEISALIRESGFAERFVLTGYCPDVEPLCWAMDIIVHASIEPEPCGMVILEGMAAHRPVIAMAAGGPLELIRDGIDGRLLPPGDVTALRTAIMELAADDAGRKSMGERAYQTVLERFDAKVIAPQMWELYLSLVRSAASPNRALSVTTQEP